ncbi:PLP-dependent cysteine synthase family protein [Siccirubricoccus deserti]
MPPLVRLPRLKAADGLVADLALKLEFFNPLGSVKDRIGLAMVEAAERAGLIAPGRSTLVEPTSGNTGIALAFVAAAKGYRLIVVMPDGASIERRKMMRLMGTEVELTPPAAAWPAPSPGRRRSSQPPRGLDAEAVRQPGQPRHPRPDHGGGDLGDTAGLVDVVIGGIGTGGTLTGVARALKPRRPGLRVIGVEPAESAVLSGDEAGPHGIQGIGAGFRPAVLDLDVIDRVVRVTEREAIAAARRCAQLEGLPVGISSGAMLHAALEVAREPGLQGGLVVGIAPSFAERYLSTELFAGM